MTALSGVRSSWDMLARNSDLWRLATASSADLVSSSWNNRAFTMAIDDWDANVRSSSTISGRELPDRASADHQHPDDQVCRGPWARRAPTASRPAGAPRGAHRAGASVTSATCSGRRWVTARPTSVVERGIGRLAEPGQQLVAGAERRPDQEPVGLVVVLHDRAAVGAREAYRVGDDPVQHLVRIEGRAHDLSELAEGLDLLHLGGQIRSAGLQRTHQLDLAERDRRLGREVVQHPHLVVAERRDLRCATSRGLRRPRRPASSEPRGACGSPASRWRSCRPYSASPSTSGDLLGPHVVHHPADEARPAALDGVVH